MTNQMQIEPARSLPVLASCDVLVCGGGVAGIAAALAAARTGAKTILLEREYLLGGLATLGLVTIYLPLCDGKGHQVSFGIPEELLRLSVRKGIVGSPLPTAWLEGGTTEEKQRERFRLQYDPSVFALEAEALLVQAGVQILYGTLCAGVLKDKRRITHAVIENKSGRSALQVNAVVDSTGDADVAQQAGARCALYGKGNVISSWYYSVSEKDGYFLRPLGESYNDPEVFRYTGVDGEVLSRTVVESHRRQLADVMRRREADGTYAPAVLPGIPQVRETRRIVGLATPDDADAFAFCPTSLGMFSDWRKSGPVYELPFACLYGAEVDNLIAAGRNISVTDPMWDITRVIPVCAVSGQAAGTAAALLPAGGAFGSLNTEVLQQKLRADGVKLHCNEVL